MSLSSHDGAPSWGILSPRQFARLAQFVQDNCGIKLPPAKKTMVEGRLRRRLRALEMASIGDYCDFLFERNGLATEAEHVINAITTNKTDFFREPQHFHFLQQRALPALLADPHRDPRQPLKLWSAASSTGAEPYTIAMVMADFAARCRNLRFEIHATDICTEVLQQAVLGIYGMAVADQVPPEYRRRYLLRSRDPERQQIRVAPALRASVRFRHLNLMAEEYPLPTDMDVIFCRNVLIYFDRETQRRVVGHLCRHLRPGGFLFVGHTESLAGQSLPVTPVATATFMRKGA